MRNIIHENLTCLQEFLNNQERWRTYNPGLKIRTVWVRVPPPLLEKAEDLQEN
jgi:hypothetical protein